MKNQKLRKVMTNGVVKVLDNTLKTKANTASCTLWYEPKAPDKLNRFRKERLR